MADFNAAVRLFIGLHVQMKNKFVYYRIKKQYEKCLVLEQFCEIVQVAHALLIHFGINEKQVKQNRVK